MLKKKQYLKLLILFTVFLMIGLQQNPGFGVITGVFILFMGFNKSKFGVAADADDDDDKRIVYVLFYLFLVFFGLVMSWFNLLKGGIQGYKINSKTLALKRPVYFIYFSFIFLIITCFITYDIIEIKDIQNQIIYSLFISFFFFFNYLNLLVESGPCNKINEKDIVQSFDCEEIKINKIDE